MLQNITFRFEKSHISFWQLYIIYISLNRIKLFKQILKVCDAKMKNILNASFGKMTTFGAVEEVYLR